MAQIRDLEIETKFIQSVLGVGENDGPGRLSAELATQQITKDCFTENNYWEIYSEAKKLAEEGVRLDQTAVAARVRPESRQTLASSWPVIPQYTSIRVLGQKLIEYKTRRSAAEIGRRIIREAESNQPGFQGSLISAAASLNRSFSSDGSGIEHGKEVFERFRRSVEIAQDGGDGLAIKTGIKEFDSHIGGLPKSFLSIIGAYPGCFKSGLLATIGSNCAFGGRRVGFFSLEDNATWIAKRYVSRASGIPVQEITKRKLNENEILRIWGASEIIEKILDNMFFDGRSSLTGYDVAASARFMIANHGCELIIIDHIGELRPMSSRLDRYDLDVSDNVSAIRDVAKDCGVAVLMAAHLKRRQESDEDIYRVPRMTDFSDSSSLEKKCRLALGLWQPQESQDHIKLKVLKQNEGGSRGDTFLLRKDKTSAMVMND